jgi:hypothetical protein
VILRFVGRWLTHAFGLVLALPFAVLAMQAPALTHEYGVALLQVTQDARFDIEQRKASARQFYSIGAADDAGVVAALKPVEPSNAATLALSIERVHVLRGVFDRLGSTPVLLQPLVAVSDAFDDPHGYKAAVWRTLLATYDMQLSFSTAAILYGLAGLLTGSFAAQLCLALLRGFAGRLGRRGPVALR